MQESCASGDSCNESQACLACGSALPTAMRQCTAATSDMSRAYTLSGSSKLQTAANEFVSQTCTHAMQLLIFHHVNPVIVCIQAIQADAQLTAQEHPASKRNSGQLWPSRLLIRVHAPSPWLRSDNPS